LLKLLVAREDLHVSSAENVRLTATDTRLSVYTMEMLTKTLLVCCFMGTAAFAQSAPTLAKVFDSQIASAEGEIVGLAEAMPAEKYGFAPTAGTFTGVRTFALQVRHIATVNYEVAAAALGAECPVAKGKNENGSDDVKTKAQIVQYLKDSFAYAHKAAQMLTPENELGLVKSPFGDGQMTRLSAVSIVTWHSFDHYGQMVVYGRMNKVIPPASK
jgi:hypothetical protein